MAKIKIAVAGAGLFLASTSLTARPSQSASETCPHAQAADGRARCRADLVIQSLRTIDAKLAAARNGFKVSGVVEPVPADGPAGLRSAGVATALPSPISVAASFDPAIASLHGDVIGAEARAAGKTTVYGPALDVLRTWHSGRVAESFGEDPVLAARMAVASVRAIQARKVIATVKHFAAYTQEAGRLGDSPVGGRPTVNELVSERVLREIYYPPFEAAVTLGGAGGVMCAFPRLNGVYACENRSLLGTLKDEWGFDGAVVPDFPSAQRSVVASVNAGLDIGTFYPTSAFPGAPAVTPGGDIDLTTAVKSGKVSEARLDDLLRRRLVPGYRIGVFDPAPTGKDTDDVSSDAHIRAAITIAEAGAVLLKNEGKILPLAGQRRIAVIGAQAGDHPVVAEGGSANVVAHSAGVAWRAIAARAGRQIQTSYEAGALPLGELPGIPASALRAPDGRPGLLATYVNNPRREFGQSAVAQRLEPGVLVNAPPAIDGLAPNNGWSVRWSGTFTSPTGGLQRFTLSGSGSGRLLLDGKQVAEFQRADFGTTAYASITLPSGRPVTITVEWTPREAAPMPRMEMFGTALGTTIHLGWASVGGMIERAAAAAAKSDVALVFVAKETSEGADQLSLALPAEQDALISAVAAANPRTVVVLAAGGPVAMPWLGKVAGVLDLWYPGDGFAASAAALLFGDAAPGGRLPITFPASTTQGRGGSDATYPGLQAPDGSLDTVRFHEGLAVGYRYFQKHGQIPLFPFGFGLTYAPMQLATPKLSAAPGGVGVAVAVSNTGVKRDMAVVQAYVTHPAYEGEPGRMLAGFDKVTVEAGSTTQAAFTLPLRAFQHWDERQHRWSTSPGRYQIEIGTSSDSFVSAQTVMVTADGTISLK